MSLYYCPGMGSFNSTYDSVRASLCALLIAVGSMLHTAARGSKSPCKPEYKIKRTTHACCLHTDTTWCLQISIGKLRDSKGADAVSEGLVGPAHLPAH